MSEQIIQTCAPRHDPNCPVIDTDFPKIVTGQAKRHQSATLTYKSDRSQIAEFYYERHRTLNSKALLYQSLVPSTCAPLKHPLVTAAEFLACTHTLFYSLDIYIYIYLTRFQKHKMGVKSLLTLFVVFAQ